MRRRDQHGNSGRVIGGVAVPTNRGWLTKWLRGQPHQMIGGAEAPYLLRRYVIPRNPLLNIYIHTFLRSDDERALHDHPWPFLTVVLVGGYNEVTERGIRGRRAGSVAYRPARWRHRVALWRRHDGALVGGTELPCWTLVITGPRVRQWGFWCKQVYGARSAAGAAWGEQVSTARAVIYTQQFVPWKQFGASGCGETT